MTDWCCQSLLAPGSWQTAEAPQVPCHPLLPSKQVGEGIRQVGEGIQQAGEGNRQADGAAVNPLSSPPPSNNLRKEEEWKQILAWQSGHPPSQPSSAPQVPLCNRFEALELKREGVEGGLSMRLPRVKRSIPRLKTASTQKDRRVVVIDDSLLRGMEGPICRPDLTCRDLTRASLGHGSGTSLGDFPD